MRDPDTETDTSLDGGPVQDSGARHGDQDPGSSRRVDPWPGVRPIVGVIHLLPLPGSPGWGGSMQQILDRALEEARILSDGGLNGLIVENFGDAPFFPQQVPPETVAAMTLVAGEIVRATPFPVGVNVLRNDAQAAMAVAVASGARFIRVNVHTGSMYTDQGLIQGQAHKTLRLRKNLGAEIAILADVLVKHASPPPGTDLVSAGRDTWARGMADGLILTGSETGSPVKPEEIRRAREGLPEGARIWAGSGATAETAAALLQMADGLIVGSALQAGGKAGGGTEAPRVHAFMRAAGRGRV